MPNKSTNTILSNRIRLYKALERDRWIALRRARRETHAATHKMCCYDMCHNKPTIGGYCQKHRP